MSLLIFHKGTRQHACGNAVEFFRGSRLTRFSTGFSLGLFTGFVVEKKVDQRFFLAFNNTTNTTFSYY